MAVPLPAWLAREAPLGSRAQWGAGGPESCAHRPRLTEGVGTAPNGRGGKERRGRRGGGWAAILAGGGERRRPEGADVSASPWPSRVAWAGPLRA